MRCTLQTRQIAERKTQSLATPWGPVTVKAAYLPNGKIRYKPEFADCQRIAVANHLAIMEVYAQINSLLENIYPTVSD